MATPRQVLDDVLRQFETVYGYSLYSALPRSETRADATGRGTVCLLYTSPSPRD